MISFVDVSSFLCFNIHGLSIHFMFTILLYSTDLLHCMRMIGQQGDNTFTSLAKVSESGTVDPQHPVFGLKKDLIRLLANMAHKNKQNQDMVNAYRKIIIHIYNIVLI